MRFWGIVITGGLMCSAVLHAFNAQTSPLWPSGNVTISLQLGPLPNGPLLDGSTSWADPIEAAMNEWNQHLGLTQLRAVRDGNATHARLNGANTVVFSDSIHGTPWTGRTIAYSVYWWQSGRRIETDIMFKSPGVDWNSYRGNQRGATYDIRRFALHELGHSIGLDHPDDTGEIVTAIMNGTLGDPDRLQADDITGVRTLYANNSPAITAQPTARSATLGASVTFTVAAIGVPPPTYQWRRNGTAIAGATATSLTLSNITANDLGAYTVVVSNSAGSVTSENALLTLSSVPVIATQPASRAVGPGDSVTLTVSAINALTYQWRRDGVAIPGATAASLALPNIPIGNPVAYTVVLSNTNGSTTSDPAIITVNWARLTNLSVRTSAGAGAQTLIAGFVVSGVGSKNVLVRAVGPTLDQFGVPGPLANPRLDLFQASSVRLGNDNWGGSPVLMEAFRGVGAFLLPTASLDAASTTTLPPTNYTMQVTGVGGITGVALAELYDAAPMSGTRLSNVSVRAHVDVGANILIVGLSISGTVSKSILLRAVGPTLTEFNVTDVLADPKLELFSSQPAKIAENDNWGGTSALANSFTAVGAFPLPAASRDAVLLITLPPGSYTAQASGVANTRGVALVEVYEVP